MNKDDKNSLRAFKSMFGALSLGIKRKFEVKAAVKELEYGSSPAHRHAAGTLPFVVIPGNSVESKDGDAEHAQTPPPLLSNLLEDRGTNVIPFGGITAAKART